jgi:diguanylate cyclase (GGDEF)-like protein/PAS domain S-box-containing protein
MGDTAYHYIVNHSRDFITLIDNRYVYELVNDAYCSAIGLPREQIVGKSVAEVWGEERFKQNIRPRIDQCLNGEEVHFVEEFRFGSVRKSLHVSFYPYVSDSPGSVTPSSHPPTHVLVFSHDISHLADIETRLAHYEYRDRTTGLFNRKFLEEKLTSDVEQALRTPRPTTRALLFVTVRSFKKINQRFGHHIGDLLLENTANRIKDAIRASDTVFRFDGTNLVVYLSSISQVTDAAMVARKISDDVGVPYQFRGSVISIECHIGIALFPDDARASESLIQQANSASVQAEEQGLAFLFHDKKTHEQAVARMETLSDLHAAISMSELELYYHPIVGIQDQRCVIVGAEALIRWNHPERGLLAPDQFIELADGSRLIAAIDKWALFRSVSQLAQWSERYQLFLSMNVSAHEFRDEYLPEIVSSALAKNPGLDPRLLKIELTERRSMEDPVSSIRQMHQLTELGVDIWIDDFGTGQSSLSYLKDLPATVLKIDKGLVDGIEEREADRRYLAGIVESIRARGKQIVAEGVMNERQTTLIQALGCEFAQGFYFAHPMRTAEFEALLANGVPARIEPCRLAESSER